jgi:type II restriction enzyme
MATAHQDLGARGEKAVCRHASCPRCNRSRHFKQLPTNFECADLICKFCGFLAQVKATRLPEGSDAFPERIMGAAWTPQHERILAGVYNGLYLAGFKQNGRSLIRIDYVPPHILEGAPEVFEPRKPLSATAKRAGWQGYMLNVGKLPAVGMQQVFPATP